MGRKPLSGTKRSVTLKDVAQEAGVSAAAVSFALHGGGNLSDEMRKRLVEVAQKAGYRANRLARATRTGKSNSIGLIIPDLCNPYFPELAQSIEQAARDQGFLVVLVDEQNSDAGTVSVYDLLVSNGVDGIIWCTAASGKYDPETVPSVVIGLEDGRHDCVTSEDRQGGELVAEYLQSRQHKKVGLISSSEVGSALNPRRSGFLDSASDKFDVAWHAISSQSSTTLDAGAAELISQGDVSAVVCGNDLIAIGALNELRRQGRCVPEDVAVIGFDDISWCEVAWPKLTTVRQPFARMGHSAIDLLIKRISDPDRDIQKVVHPVKLIERESC